LKNKTKFKLKHKNQKQLLKNQKPQIRVLLQHLIRIIFFIILLNIFGHLFLDFFNQKSAFFTISKVYENFKKEENI